MWLGFFIGEDMLDKNLLWNYLKSIPKGKVVTYKDCALVLGNKNLARVVGNFLHNNPDPEKIPCYKVVNAKGCLADNFAFGGIERQKELLEAEGIKVRFNFVDLTEYHYKS